MPSIKEGRKKEQYFTFSQFKKRFLVEDKECSDILIRDPFEHGIELSKESLEKQREVLSE